jgi:hypothetical protein
MNMEHRQPIVVLVATVSAVLAGDTATGQTHDHTRATVAAAPWSQPVQLSGYGAIGSPGGTHPLAIYKTAYAVWVQNGVIHLSTSADSGVTWDHPTRLTVHNTALYPCSLELSGPVLHLVWPDTRHHGLAEPYYKRSADGGKTWTEEVRLSPGTDLFRVGTAVSGPAVHVVWFNRHFLEKVPAGGQTWTWTWGEVYYCRSMDGGTAWGPDVRMSHNEWHSRHPQIMTGGADRVCCVWEDGAIWDGKTSSGWSGDGALDAAVSSDNGRTWNPPECSDAAQPAQPLQSQPNTRTMVGLSVVMSTATTRQRPLRQS